MTNEEKLTQFLQTMADILKGNLSTESIKIYRRLFEPYKFSEIQEAFDRWTNSNNFFPTPNEIIEIIRDNRADARRKMESMPAYRENYADKTKDIDWDKNIDNLRDIIDGIGRRDAEKAYNEMKRPKNNHD